jgi:Ca-activated chloride channel family protein
MPTPAARWPWVLATSFAAASVAGVAAQRFQTGVDIVHLPVTVAGRNGELIRGLTADDFEVLEDGHPQKIAIFTEGTTGVPLPLHLGVLLDTSESMDQDLKAAEEAAVRFIDRLDEALDVTFVDFDTGVRVGHFWPSSYPQLFERIRARKAGGSTALYDALGVYLRGTLSRDGQHVLLLYTDGGDTSSSLNFSKLVDLLRLGHVLVYVVGYLENQQPNDRLAQQMRVTQIARETGGVAFFPTSPADVRDIDAKILEELASRYTLGYVPSNATPDGRFRKVEVRVTRTDLKGAKIRTRSGYVAAPSPVGR